MCSMFLPRSSMSTRRPFSVSSLAAQPPEIPDPTTIASYSGFCIKSSLSIGVTSSAVSFQRWFCRPAPKNLVVGDRVAQDRFKKADRTESENYELNGIRDLNCELKRTGAEISTGN